VAIVDEVTSAATQWSWLPHSRSTARYRRVAIVDEVTSAALEVHGKVSSSGNQ